MPQLYNLAKEFGSKVVAQYLHHKTDAYIISHPRSGRTWLRLLIGKALCEMFKLPDKEMLDIYKLTTSAGISRTQLIHDHTSYTESYKYYYLSWDKRIYSDKKVIFLVRSIKDVIVSYYFYVTKRDKEFDDSISNFIRTERYGAERIVNFYNSWYESQNIPKEFMLLRYEDMMENTKTHLMEVFSFLGLEKIDETSIENAIQFAQFENLKKLEKNNYFDKKAMRPADEKDSESYKIRKGKVGGYEQYLSEDDSEYIDSVIRKIGCPFETN